jgi:hypothetical protein
MRMGLWAIAVATTTTTITTTTKAVTTTVQTSTTLAPSGQSGNGVDPWTDVAVPLGAVLIGALAALAGSMWVNRRQLIQTTRVRMFRDQLPALMPARLEWLATERQHGQGYGIEPYNRALDALWRDSVIAGREDRVRVEALIESDKRRQEVLSAGTWSTDRYGKVSWTGDHAALRQVDEDYSSKVGELNKYLQDKIR